MFQKNATELVRGIRANKKNEQKYINSCIAEIKDELKSPDVAKKAIAVQKLTYLQMLGYDMNWAAFNVIEVMSSTKFNQKRIGYLAAAQSFRESTEVIMLTTNLFKKDFISQNPYESGLALSTLSNVCTPDLARDLVNDVVSLLNHSKPYVRKKAVLTLYKIFLQFPGALRPSFPRLKDKLEDTEVSVISAAVNVICELARMNPEKYLPLAPIFFKLLTVTTNNWMLIKIVKLFGALTPHEPRLAKKLVEPLTNLINSTPAMSLLYECINTCTIGLAEHVPVIQLCISKLRMFIEDNDQNLKYLGLLALSNIMNKHPRAVAEHRDMVMRCLEDEDVTIRLRALDLIAGMVTKKSLQEIVRRLMDQVKTAEGSYREDLIAKIISICSQDSYEYIKDFEWYISVLVELTRVRGTKHGKLIAGQLMDVAIRVQVVRPFATKHMVNVLLDPRFLAEASVPEGITEVLFAAAWIVGEFARTLEHDTYQRIVESLTQPRVLSLLPHIQGVFIQNCIKLWAELLRASVSAGGSLVQTGEAPEEEDDEENDPEMAASYAKDISTLLKDKLVPFTQSVFSEVQERACSAIELLKLADILFGQNVPGVQQAIAALFAEQLNPVAPKAQRKVPVPAGLDLDAWINDPPKDDSFDDGASDFSFLKDRESDIMPRDNDDDDRTRAERVQNAEKKRQGNINYLGPSRSSKADLAGIDVDSIPITELNLDGKKKRRRHGDPKPVKQAYVVAKVEDLPPGARDDDDDKAQGKSDVAKALDIDVFSPLTEKDALPEAPKHYQVKAKPAAAAAPEKAPEPAGRRRRRHGEAAPDAAAAAAPAAGAAPAQQDAGRRHRKRGESTSAPTATTGTLIPLSVTSPAPAAAPSVASPSYEAISSPAAPAPAADDGHRRRRRRGEGEAAAAAPAASPSAPAAPAAGAVASGLVPQRFVKTIGQDANMVLKYEVIGTHTSPLKLTVALGMTNTSGNIISRIEIAIMDTMNMRVLYPDPNQSSLRPNMTIFGGVTEGVNIEIGYQGFSMPQAMRGTITYVCTSTGPQDGKIDFKLDFPVSSFVAPLAVSQSDFARVCSGQANCVASAKIDARLSPNFSATLQAIMNLLHVSIVHADPGAASLYGKSLAGDHVALLVKDMGGTKASVDMKTSDQTLADNLIREVQQFFAA